LVEIIEVSTNAAIGQVAALAGDIWREHFTPIIGGDQVEYMLAKFQSADAVAQQIAAGAEYYLVKVQSEWVGYIGLVPERASGRMMLSKIYLQDSARGKGLGKQMLDYVAAKCLADGFTCIWLTVNRLNAGPIAWYKHCGFAVVDEVKKDIGGGFFMDDYVMEKRLGIKKGPDGPCGNQE
jgi:GNAT superfamily N-acetyltransferase